jgi:putative ABC transport system permease protein
VLPAAWRQRWADETVDSFIAHLEDARTKGAIHVASAWGRGVLDILRWTVTLRLPAVRRRSMTKPHLAWIATDLKFAARVYRQRPVQTATIVATMAGAIGICATVFSAVNSILLRPLPFPHPERLVTILQKYPNAAGFGTLSWANYRDLATRVSGFEHVGVAVGTRSPATVAGTPPFYAETYHVSDGFHYVGAVDPILGRLPVLNAEGAVESLISEDLWARLFARDSTIIGRALETNNSNSIIVGVLPSGASLPRGAEVWVVSEIQYWWGSGRTLGGLIAFARLKKGIGLEAVRTQADGLADAIRAEAGSEVGADFRFQIDGLHEDLTRNARETLILLTCAVAAVFLIACINVAGIATSQYLARQRELALRVSLGAGRLRITWQLLTESVILALTAAAAGIAVAWILAEPLNRLLPAGYLRAGPIRPDWRILVVGVGLALTAGVASALIPIARSWRGPDFQSLRTARGEDKPSRQSGLPARALLVPQYGVSLATLVVTGLLIRTLLSLSNVDPGFATMGRVAIEMNVPASRSEQSATYQQQLADVVSGVPGVTGVAFAYSLPIIHTSSIVSELQTDRDPAGVFPVNAYWRTVSASYFDVMDIQLLAGHTFTGREQHGSAQVVISRTLAEELGGVETSLGIRLRPRLASIAGSYQDRWLEVIGIVGDLRDIGIRANPRPVVYTVNTQNANWAGNADMVVRVDRTPGAAAREIVATARRFDPELPIGSVHLLDEAVRANLHPQRFRAIILSGFGLAALLLVTIGMYGATAQSMQRRRRELAIRTALGAPPGNLMTLSIRDAAFTITLGTAIGLGITWLGTRLVRNMLFGVGTLDTTVIGGALALVAITVLIAAWLPARAASRVDPATILREE